MFDGNKKIFTFIKNSETIKSQRLDQAYLRNILKIGSIKNTNQPGLLIERDYAQTHPNSSQMSSQHVEIVKQLAKDLGATTRGQMTIFKSRNPEGHYSDSGGGVMTSDYEVNLN